MSPPDARDGRARVTRGGRRNDDPGVMKNHPFVDGNKRTGLAAMLAFLGLNGRRLEAPDDDLTHLVLGVAAGRVTKAEVAVFVRRHGVWRRGRG